MDAIYAIGSEVRCSDGGCGQLERVVVDPVTRTLTHLVVRPDEGAGRLVPVGLVEDGDGTSDLLVRLSCSTDDFLSLASAEESDVVRGPADAPGHRSGLTVAQPSYALGMGTAGTGAPGVVPVPLPRYRAEPEAAAYERVPTGEGQIRRGQRVQASDGEIGHVQGLVVDPEDQQVTYVLLQEGHLLGKRTVAIPISAVTRVGHAVRVHLSRQELSDLPTVTPSDIQS